MLTFGRLQLQDRDMRLEALDFGFLKHANIRSTWWRSRFWDPKNLAASSNSSTFSTMFPNIQRYRVSWTYPSNIFAAVFQLPCRSARSNFWILKQHKPPTIVAYCCSPDSKSTKPLASASQHQIWSCGFWSHTCPICGCKISQALLELARRSLSGTVFVISDVQQQNWGIHLFSKLMLVSKFWGTRCHANRFSVTERWVDANWGDRLENFYANKRNLEDPKAAMPCRHVAMSPCHPRLIRLIWLGVAVDRKLMASCSASPRTDFDEFPGVSPCFTHSEHVWTRGSQDRQITLCWIMTWLHVWKGSWFQKDNQNWQKDSKPYRQTRAARVTWCLWPFSSTTLSWEA